jgi:hypothetical protein
VPESGPIERPGTGYLQVKGREPGCRPIRRAGTAGLRESRPSGRMPEAGSRACHLADVKPKLPPKVKQVPGAGVPVLWTPRGVKKTKTGHSDLGTLLKGNLMLNVKL